MDEGRQTSLAILRWVTMAFKPLRLEELAVAVNVQPASPLITLEQAISDEIALCAPFVKIQKQEVTLVHQSARDYISQGEQKSDTVLRKFRAYREDPHLELTRKCLDCVANSGWRYMSFDLNTSTCSRESPLLEYAAFHWPMHARRCSDLAAELFDLSKPFFHDESTVREHWWKAYCSAGHFFRPPILILRDAAYTQLHLACYLSIIPWASALLNSKRHMPRPDEVVNKKDKYGITALHWAASCGNKAMT